MNLLHSNDKAGRHPESWYAATSQPVPSFEPLDGDIHCDVCVVGAGYTGLSAALHLAQQGLDVRVLEAHRAGWGASGRNGGQVGTGYNCSLQQLEKWLDKPSALALWQLSLDACRLVKNLIDQYNIPCDYTPGILQTTWKARHLPQHQQQIDYLAQYYDYRELTLLDKAQVRNLLGTDVYAGGTLDQGGAHLHPLNYALGLVEAAVSHGARLHEQTEVTGLTAGDTMTVNTGSGTVQADCVVLACNGYLGNLNADIAAHVMPINNFIVATEPLTDIAPEVLRGDMAVCDSKFVVNYFRRSTDGRLLFGGGENYGYRFPRNIENVVRKPLRQVFPQLAHCRIDYAWGGTLAITPNRLPSFRRLQPNLYSASGYSGHGVALASLAGKLIADAIADKPAAFDLLGRLPRHRFPGGDKWRNPLLVLAMSAAALLDRLP